MLLEPIQRVEHHGHVLRQRLDDERVALTLESRGGEAENAEVRRESSHLGNLLRADAAMRGRQADHGFLVAAQPARTLERQHVGRIGYDFGAAQRRQHLVLAREPDDGAHAKRSDGRQLHRFKCGRRRQEVAIDFDEAALIDDGRLHEPIAIPLLHQVGRPACGGARLRNLEQERPEPRRRQSVRDGVVGARRQSRFDPWPYRLRHRCAPGAVASSIESLRTSTAL